MYVHSVNIHVHCTVCMYMYACACVCVCACVHICVRMCMCVRCNLHAIFYASPPQTQLHLNHEKRCREEDQAHHAAMLRELQELVVGEREGKTHLGAKLVEAEAALSRLHVQVSQDRLVWPRVGKGVGSCFSFFFLSGRWSRPHAHVDTTHRSVHTRIHYT